MDPVAAVTAFVPGETGAAASPRPAPPGTPMTMPAVVRVVSGRGQALMVGGIAFAVVVVVAAVGVILPRGRRRGWRPGRYVGPTGQA